MEEDQEDIFKKLIQKSESDKVDPDFTKSIMKIVQAGELVQETALRSLLADNLLEKPSASFEMQIMSRVIPVAKKAEKPIISKNVWYLIAASLLLIIGYSLVAQSPQINTDTNSFTFKIGDALTGFSQNVNQLPVLFSITFMVLGALMMGDYFILQRLAKN